MFASGDGRVRVECRFESDTIWLSQAAMAELYDKDVRTINEHLINIFSEGELVQNSTIRKFRIVAFSLNSPSAIMFPICSLMVRTST